MREYFYLRLYKCKGGNHPVDWLVAANNPALPDSYFTATEAQQEIWCDYPGCGWNGKVGELQFVRTVRLEWLP